MVTRNQSAVVREITFDQPGRDLDRADFEPGVALAETKCDLVGIADHTRQLLECTTRHEHFLALAENGRAGQVTHRQTVRVGGHKTKAVFLGSHEHTGENRASVITRRGLFDLIDRRSER